jgi:hypothetical protein
MQTKALSRTLLLLSLLGAPALADVIECAEGHEPFTNGFCARAHSKPMGAEGWVRGKANLNRDTGDVHIFMQLETDSVAAGPCGKIAADFLEEDGTVLATITTGEACRGGKPPGKAVRSDAHSNQPHAIPVAVAKKVTKIVVRPTVTGIKKGLFGLTILGFLDPAKIEIKIPL